MTFTLRRPAGVIAACLAVLAPLSVAVLTAPAASGYPAGGYSWSATITGLPESDCTASVDTYSDERVTEPIASDGSVTLQDPAFVPGFSTAGAFSVQCPGWTEETLWGDTLTTPLGFGGGGWFPMGDDQDLGTLAWAPQTRVQGTVTGLPNDAVNCTAHARVDPNPGVWGDESSSSSAVESDGTFGVGFTGLTGPVIASVEVQCANSASFAKKDVSLVPGDDKDGGTWAWGSQTKFTGAVTGLPAGTTCTASVEDYDTNEGTGEFPITNGAIAAYIGELSGSHKFWIDVRCDGFEGEILKKNASGLFFTADISRGNWPTFTSADGAYSMGTVAWNPQAVYTGTVTGLPSDIDGCHVDASVDRGGAGGSGGRGPKPNVGADGAFSFGLDIESKTAATVYLRCGDYQTLTLAGPRSSPTWSFGSKEITLGSAGGALGSVAWLPQQRVEAAATGGPVDQEYCWASAKVPGTNKNLANGYFLPRSGEFVLRGRLASSTNYETAVDCSGSGTHYLVGAPGNYALTTAKGTATLSFSGTALNLGTLTWEHEDRIAGTVDQLPVDGAKYCAIRFFKAGAAKPMSGNTLKADWAQTWFRYWGLTSDAPNGTNLQVVCNNGGKPNWVTGTTGAYELTTKPRSKVTLGPAENLIELGDMHFLNVKRDPFTGAGTVGTNVTAVVPWPGILPKGVIPTITYSWLVDGVQQATTASLAIPAEWAGKSVAVKVTQTWTESSTTMTNATTSRAVTVAN